MGEYIVGIMFQDITTLLLDPAAFKDTIDLFVERYKDKNISVVAGKYVYVISQFISHFDVNVMIKMSDVSLKSIKG